MRRRELIATVLVIVLGLALGGCAGDSGSSSTSLGAITTTTVAGTGNDSTTAADSSTLSSTTSTTRATTTTTITGKTVRYQQNDSHLKYAGAWKTSTTGSPSGGSLAFANSSGSKVTIKFEGIHLALFAKKSPKYGKALITLDGKKLGTIDLYSSKTLYQEKVWGSGRLSPGEHTVIVEWTGTKRSAATDTNINIDAVVVTQPLE